MLQRLQSVYLLLASVAMLVAVVTPLALFTSNSDRTVFVAAGISINGQLSNATWGLFIIGVAGSALAFITLFLYRKRILQIRLSVINIILITGFYLYSGLVIYQYCGAENLCNLKIGTGIVMPAVAILNIILAMRRISADEALVRSLNRLRK